MLDHALERFPGEVKSIEFGIALLQGGDNAQTLGVVVETTPRLHHLPQRILPRMAERRVTKVVG